MRLGTKLGAKDSIYALGGYNALNWGGGLGTAAGWRIGAGYERRIGGSEFLKIEYNHGRTSKYGVAIASDSVLLGIGSHF